MRNHFINDYRRQRKIQETRIELERFETTNADSATLVGEIESALSKIKPDKLKCLRMHMNGFKYREIADAHNLPIGTVKSKIHAARNEFINQTR